jgi:hypothetical protein
MELDKLDELVKIVSKGNTTSAEALFSKPAGRKHLESIVAIVLSNLPYSTEEKEELFGAFRTVLYNLEKRINHQKQGQEILRRVYRSEI